MEVLISGSTGLVGRMLVPRLETAGHEVTRLVRPDTTDDAAGVSWDPSRGEIDRAALEGFDAVVHLAGESIDQRWTEGAKRRIRESRVRGTRLLARALAELDDPPAVLVSASGISYYGDRGATPLTEAADPGDLFLSEVCVEWERESRVAAENGVRVVNLRTGVVLTTEGGALSRMLPPFKLGVGGRLGSGEQYMSWVTREDVVGVVEHLLDSPDVDGPVNVCSPNPVTNRTFTDTLGDVLGRPTVFVVPEPAIRLAFGQMGEELLLASVRARPSKLDASGYQWAYPELESALDHVLEPE
jgi:uncharacterized protein (TIGR01777 family)